MPVQQSAQKILKEVTGVDLKGDYWVYKLWDGVLLCKLVQASPFDLIFHHNPQTNYQNKKNIETFLTYCKDHGIKANWNYGDLIVGNLQTIQEVETTIRLIYERNFLKSSTCSADSASSADTVMMEEDDQEFISSLDLMPTKQPNEAFINKILNENVQLTQQNNELSHLILNLREQIAHQQQNIHFLQTKLSTMTLDQTELQCRIAVIENEKDSKDLEISKLKKEMTILKDKFEDQKGFREKLKSISSLNESMIEELQASENMIAKLRSELDSQEQYIIAQSSTNFMLVERNEWLEKELKGRDMEIEGLIDNLKSVINTRQNVRCELETSLINKNEQIVRYQQENEILKQELAKEEAKMKRFVQQILEANQKKNEEIVLLKQERDMMRSLFSGFAPTEMH
jgi:DNA repair exonuclease SbcCD ATPase subunit